MKTLLGLSKYKMNSYIKREELVKMIKEESNYMNESSIRWTIYDLVHSKQITKIDSKHFIKGYLHTYKVVRCSEQRKEVENKIKQYYPYIDTIIYESNLLNEWVNHQISKNVVFVQVEKDFTDYIYRMLKEKTKLNILLKPDKKEFYLNDENNSVVITNLITQSPKVKNTYNIKIEKLIVDLYSKDLITEFISMNEYESVIEQIYRSYVVNSKTLLGYAKRRNVEDKVFQAIKDYLPD